MESHECADTVIGMYNVVTHCFGKTRNVVITCEGQYCTEV